VRARATLLLALVVAGCGGSSDDPATTAAPPKPPPKPPAKRPARPPVDRLSLSEQVGQTIVFSYEGAEVPDYVVNILREGRGSGVILFGDNVAGGREQLVRATKRLQRGARGSALIATDQEGGDVRIIPFAGPQTGQPSLSTPDAAAAAATEGGRDLRRLGVNVDLAPVVDVSGPGGGFGGRTYPGGPRDVARIGAAAIRALGRQGVGATAKHFPGLGAAATNTDQGPVTVDGSPPLAPFRAAVRAKVPLVMASHALYPELDPDRIASQSPTILQGLLRERLGFRGAIITDSLEARAVIDRSDAGTAAVRSLRAGADIVLSTGSGSYRDVYDALLAAARRSPAVRTRVRVAAARVLELKRRLGLRTPR
jgi:beta-N-acetylhexosaminidase